MNFSELQWLDLASLFFFSMASAGFVLFTLKYPRNSDVRLWGIRTCHVFGFIGVAFHRWSHGQFTEPALLIISALTVSVISFEIANRFLEPS